MSKNILVSAIVLLLVMLTATIAFAAVPAPGGPFTSTMVIQNTSGTEASCSYKLYDSSGTEAYSSSAFSVAASDSEFVYMSTLGISSAAYSAIVSCDQQVVAMSSFADSDSEGGYRGITVPADTYFAPGIYDDYYGYYSNISVQNTTSSGVDVTVSIYPSGSSTPVATQTATNVPAYATHSFDQTGLTGLLENVTYSAKISAVVNGTSTPADIAVVVAAHGSADGLPAVGDSTPQSYAYNAFSEGFQTWYAPVLAVNYYGWQTALVVQNIGSGPTDVTVLYSNGESDTKLALAPNASWSMYMAVQSALADNPGNVIAAATITSSAENIVVMVNESNNYQRAATYTGLSGGGTALFAPMVVKGDGNYQGSITCQNLYNGSNTVTVDFIGSPSAPSHLFTAIGQTYVFYTPNITDLASGFVGAAAITADTGSVACIINRSYDTGTNSADDLTAYESMVP